MLHNYLTLGNLQIPSLNGKSVIEICGFHLSEKFLYLEKTHYQGIKTESSIF